MTDKPTKTVRRRVRTAKPKAAAPERLRATHAEISERAYYIHLEGGEHDELANWLQAETELTAA
jgi:Protein of unknown function (DUF2934)